MIDNPLITVSVLTYNSSKTILNTLESIKNQTYGNIELIISDDYSKDDTVSVVNGWITQNSSRFTRCVFLTSDRNVGVTANLNKVLRIAEGEWHKGIAADDKLLPECIQDIVDYIKSNPDVDFGFGRVSVVCTDDYRTFSEEMVRKLFLYTPFLLSKKEFLYLILEENFLPAASAFKKISSIRNLGYYDESIPMIEDWPMWIKAAAAGMNFGFLDCVVAEYRISPSSVSNNPSSRYMDNLRLVCKKRNQYAKRINIMLYLHFLMYKHRFGFFRFLDVFNPVHHYYKAIHRKMDKMDI